MNVAHTNRISDTHSIELGDATWNSEVQSIRNRYNSEVGRFSPRGSSEIPLPDLEPIMQMAASHDLLDVATCERIIIELRNSIQRQSKPTT